ncbi:MAG TPA: protein phosphatase 2C domain-containing protein [Gemmatimonadales bacterium]|nr:protein phosphatase 2C domain-containing protein [Gemmatimonadales bacterium]
MLDLAILSDVGGRWPDMEDAHGQWTSETGELVFAVADGVGGADGGEVASRIAITKTLEAYRESPVAWGPVKRLNHAAQEANVAIHNRALKGAGLARMSTTLTAAVVADGMLRVVYVGDTRMYLVRGDEARCLTKDHTVAGERARLTWVDEDAVLDDPDRSKLTRSLGTTLIAPLDRLSLKLEAGDQLVLCTDGVYALLHTQEIGDYCRGQAAKPAAKSLLAAAKRRNPTDNLTVAVLTVPGTSEPQAPDTWRDRLFGLLRRGD